MLQQSNYTHNSASNFHSNADCRAHMGDRLLHHGHQHLLPDNELRQAASSQCTIHRLPSVLRYIWVPRHADIHRRDPLPRLQEEQEVYLAIARE